MARGGSRQVLIKYSDALATLICDKVEDGISVAEICRKYSEQGIPSEKTIYRWKKQYPQFKAALDQAYQTFFYRKIDEIEELSKAPLGLNFLELSEEQIALLDNKIVQAMLREELNRRRVRIDTLKFVLAKLAPKLVPDLKDQPSTAIQVPVINVMKFNK